LADTTGGIGNNNPSTCASARSRSRRSPSATVVAFFYARRGSSECRRGEVGEHDQEGTRQTIEALFQEHITQETYEQWRREASQEVREKLEEGAAIPSWEVRQIITKRTLLHLADRTTGEVSDSMRRVAREFGKRGDDG
jgi:hypothetical protein